MIDDLRLILNAIAQVRRISDSDEIGPENRYHAIFKLHSTVIFPALDRTGLNHKWYDPDTTYEEDVMSYVGSLDKLEKEVTGVLTAMMGGF